MAMGWGQVEAEWRPPASAASCWPMEKTKTNQSGGLGLGQRTKYSLGFLLKSKTGVNGNSVHWLKTIQTQLTSNWDWEWKVNNQENRNGSLNPRSRRGPPIYNSYNKSHHDWGRGRSWMCEVTYIWSEFELLWTSQLYL